MTCQSPLGKNDQLNMSFERIPYFKAYDVDMDATESRTPSSFPMIPLCGWGNDALNNLTAACDMFQNVVALSPGTASFISKKHFLNGPNPATFCLFSSFSHDKYSTNVIKV